MRRAAMKKRCAHRSKRLADTLGVPSADIAVNSWSRQNIRYVDAQSARGDLEQFASIFGIDADLDALLTKGE